VDDGLERVNRDHVERELHLRLHRAAAARRARAAARARHLHAAAAARGRLRRAEQRLRRAALDDGVGGRVGLALVVIAGAADAVLELHAAALLHDVRGLVRREPHSGSLRNAIRSPTVYACAPSFDAVAPPSPPTAARTWLTSCAPNARWMRSR
jgi:hypothetical protein